MRYSLHITAIPNQRAHAIVAHNLAGNRNVSLSFAQSLLETFPVVYMTDLTGDEAATVLRQLTKIGVKAHAVPSDSGGMLAMKNNQPAQDPAPPTQVAAPSCPPLPGAANQAQPDTSLNAESIYAKSVDTLTTTTKAPFIFKQEVSAQPSKRRRGGWKVAAMYATAAAALLAAGVFFAGHQWRLALRPDATDGAAADGSQRGGGNRGFNAQRIGGADSQASRQRQGTVSEQEKISAQAYVDSAATSSSDDASIAFYKMAISFNKYNADAWYGLVSAYEHCGKTDRALAAREEMKRLFGEGIFRLSAIVGRYGTLVDYNPGLDGTFRIEYRSRVADSQALVLETYQIVKAYGSLCNCAALSLYASGAASQSVLVFIKTDAPTATYDQFKAHAVIRRLEGWKKIP